MRIVLGIHSLASIGGTESYVTTVGDHLQRDGHEVWIYAEESGRSAEIADSLGLRVLSRTADIPAGIDVFLSQDMPSALELAAERPEVPQVFVSHSDTFDVNLPPQVAGLIRCVVTLYERAHRRMTALSNVVALEPLRQPVDVDRFKPVSVLSDPPRNALALGNYLTGPRLEIVRRGCELAGIEFEQIGTVAGRQTTRPEEDLNGADIVFAKAKTAHEAMACGRAVYVLDHNGAEGWITAENYAALVADNFGGQSNPIPVTAESLARDLTEYHPAMGIANRDLIVANHAAQKHVAELVSVVRRHAGDAGENGLAGPALDTRNLKELARLARVNWRHEAEAFRLRRIMELGDAARGDLEWQIKSVNAEFAAVRHRLGLAEQRYVDIVQTRRWLAINRLLGPFDRQRKRNS